MRRFTMFTRAAALAVAALALLVACAGPGPTPSASPPIPSASDTASPTPSEPAAAELIVDAYFAHNQPTRITLIPEPHTVLVPADADPVEVTLAALIDGSLSPTDPDYVNLWGDGDNRLLSLARDGSTLVVDLAVGGLSVGAEGESIAIAQLVWTATALDDTIAALRFTIDGAPAETLAGHVDLSQSFERDAAESVLSPVQIIEPAEGATVSSPVVASGVACVFEATFVWSLDGPDGLVAEGSGMTREACPARSPWSIDLGDLASGDYVLTVVELSARDGSIAHTDSTAFTVAD